MTTRRLLAAAAVLSALIAPSVARATGEPIMPLDQVQKGMHCVGSSVIQGTTISNFNVDVLDIVAGDAAARQPYILIQVSGPAVDATGIGPGFSGSPIRCPDASGTMRIIGAVSEGIGSYGNKEALATPIQWILNEPVDPPAAVSVQRDVVRAARPLATPLSVGGLSPAVANMVQSAAAKAGAVVYASPPAPSQTTFPVQTMVPGASVATGLSSGDITAGAIGTVSYVDGDTVWAFGHPLDSVGRRSLFLQDAYVYSVVNNPLGSGDLQTYKYASIGHDVGELTDDGISGIVGRTGVSPPHFPLQIVADDLDSGDEQVANMQIADETAIGLPTGSSSLVQVGSIGVAQLAYQIIDGAPAHQSGSMCVDFTISETRKPLHFCNTYVGGGGGAQSVGGGPLVGDFSSAAAMLDAYNFGPLHITNAVVHIKLTRALRQAFLLSATAPRVVRIGKSVRVHLTAQRVNGPRVSRTVTVRIPRGMPAGPRYLTLTGTSADLGGSSGDTLELTLGDLLGTGDSSASDESGPKTVGQLRAAIAGVHRPDGVTASLRPLGSDDSGGPSQGPEAIAQRERQVLRESKLRFSGAARVLVDVVH